MKAFFRTLLAVIIGFFTSIFLLVLFFMAIALSSKKEVVVANNSILKIELDHEINETPMESPLGQFSFLDAGFKSPLALAQILNAIDEAADDSKIKGIYLEVSSLRAGLSTADEIRKALKAFRDKGKFVYAYSELYTDKNYFLASVADSIYLNPEGSFLFAGFHSEQPFVKGLLDKLDIKVNLFRAGKFKSAGEMFVNDKMSPEGRLQLSEYLDSNYSYFLRHIAANRQMSVEEVTRIANNLEVRRPQDAVRTRLIDKVAYYDEVLTSMADRVGAKRPDKTSFIKLEDYASQFDRKFNRPSGEVAVIFAEGEIRGGEGSYDNIGSETLAKAIRKARYNDNVKSIVLRINSPGGSALASEVIWREVYLANQVKPVIASMGDIAASGGYYLAAPCRVVIAEPTTLTGSIGVFGLLPTIKDFWNNKLGITWDRVTTGKYSDLGNPNREIRPDEAAIIQQYVDDIYLTFKQRVSEGRGLPLETVDSLAQGRIYNGAQALARGLVNRLGTLEDAIEVAAQQAGLDKYDVKYITAYKKTWRNMFGGIQVLEYNRLVEELGPDALQFKRLQGMRDMQGILMYCPWTHN